MRSFQENLLGPTPDRYDAHQIYEHALDRIRVPDWHPRLRRDDLLKSDEFERLVQTVVKGEMIEPLLLYWDEEIMRQARSHIAGGERQDPILAVGLLRYWALLEAQQRQGTVIGAPVRLTRMSTREAMVTAARANVHVGWTPLERAYFVARLEKEMRKPKALTVEELAVHTPWKKQIVSEALAIARAFPPAVLEGLSISLDEVHALHHTPLHEAARQPGAQLQIAALVGAVQSRKARAHGPKRRGPRKPFVLRTNEGGGIENFRCPNPDNLELRDAEGLLAMLEPVINRIRAIVNVPLPPASPHG